MTQQRDPMRDGAFREIGRESDKRTTSTIGGPSIIGFVLGGAIGLVAGLAVSAIPGLGIAWWAGAVIGFFVGVTFGGFVFARFAINEADDAMGIPRTTQRGSGYRPR